MDAITSTYMRSQYENKMNQLAENATKSVSGISANSSKEEIEGAVKDFETFLMEKVIKEVKDSFVTMDKEEDDTMSMYKDLFMDKAITEMASQLVDQIGGDITDDFVEQIMRNYGITGTTGAPGESAGLDNATVSDDIAQINASTVTQIQA